MIGEKAGRPHARIEMFRAFDSAPEAARAERLMKAYRDKCYAAIDSGERAVPTIREALEPFLEYCAQIRKIQPSTLAGYRRKLLRFASLLPANAALDAFGPSELVSCVAARRKGGAGDATINGEISLLKSLGKWVLRYGGMPHGTSFVWREFEPISTVKPVRVWYTIDVLRARIARFNEEAPQVGMMLETLGYCGARPLALCTLRRTAYTPSTAQARGVATLPPLKKGWPGTKYFSKGSPLDLVFRRAEQWAKAWRRKRGRSLKLAPTDHVFLNGHGKPWTQTSFCDAVRYHADRFGWHDFTAYVVRHSLITHLKRMGLSPTEIQHYAGHRLVTTQAAYDHTVGEDGQGAVDAAADALAGNFETTRNGDWSCGMLGPL